MLHSVSFAAKKKLIFIDHSKSCNIKIKCRKNIELVTNVFSVNVNNNCRLLINLGKCIYQQKSSMAIL